MEWSKGLTKFRHSSLLVLMVQFLIETNSHGFAGIPDYEITFRYMPGCVGAIIKH